MILERRAHHCLETCPPTVPGRRLWWTRPRGRPYPVAMADNRSRDQLAEELKRTQAELATLLQHTADYILVCDHTGSPVLFNEAYRQIMAAAGIEMKLGLRPHTLLPDEEERVWWEGHHTRALSGEAFRVEYCRDFEGRQLHFEFAFNPIRRDGEVVGFTEISRDITARKQMEQEREALLEQLHQSQKMEAVGNLAGGVAHDVNNVLMAIAGLASVLEEDLDPQDPVHRDMVSILEACDRGHDLTRNLLGFARKGKFRTQRISVNRVILESTELLRRTIPKGVELCTELDLDLWEIDGDVGQLNHVLVNLALNAANAMDGKGVIVFSTKNVELSPDEAAAFPGLEPGRHVQLCVKDSGGGMPPDVLKRAFEPFFTTKAQGEGTGLGLSMVYGTVHNHGGSVRLDSAPGRGTTVAILMPAAGEAPPTATSVAEERPLASGSGTVLLVDDEQLVRETGRRMLERLGYEVLVADGGAAALELFGAHQEAIAFVILDLAMPGMDGPEVFHALRRLAPELRVCISSGYFKEEGADSLLDHGAVGFIQKPYRLKALAAAIDQFIGASG